MGIRITAHALPYNVLGAPKHNNASNILERAQVAPKLIKAAQTNGAQPHPGHRRKAANQMQLALPPAIPATKRAAKKRVQLAPHCSALRARALSQVSAAKEQDKGRPLLRQPLAHCAVIQCVIQELHCKRALLLAVRRNPARQNHRQLHKDALLRLVNHRAPLLRPHRMKPRLVPSKCTCKGNKSCGQANLSQLCVQRHHAFAGRPGNCCGYCCCWRCSAGIMVVA
ncbi:hypothetical protein BX661DRAFT_179898 [Kickxella alabastrina]|uniref:uncharacterized protein n=1 Tax=Kickxella alabastrina TaxID=61397 RepID=UPI00221FC5BF|nr:uncharacterized protein BX661DRAFT_179898 [Kickxella alabastrina]KAI7832151.1 hypothetical protein BX661DRAFT_179898 [Kickxella alabastrina]